MADLFISYDPSKPVGERLAPEVRQELSEVAPSTVNNNTITTAKLVDKNVTTEKINDGAVTSVKIASGAVETADIKDVAVTTGKLADKAVTPAKVNTGVVTAADPAGSFLPLRIVPITSTAYAALTSPDPNTLYIISTT
jgi:hypothetical protein